MGLLWESWESLCVCGCSMARNCCQTRHGAVLTSTIVMFGGGILGYILLSQDDRTPLQTGLGGMSLFFAAAALIAYCAFSWLSDPIKAASHVYSAQEVQHRLEGIPSLPTMLVYHARAYHYETRTKVCITPLFSLPPSYIPLYHPPPPQLLLN